MATQISNLKSTKQEHVTVDKGWKC